MGAEPGRRFLKQSAAKLEPVIVDLDLYKNTYVVDRLNDLKP